MTAVDRYGLQSNNNYQEDTSCTYSHPSSWSSLSMLSKDIKSKEPLSSIKYWLLCWRKIYPKWMLINLSICSMHADIPTRDLLISNPKFYKPSSLYTPSSPSNKRLTFSFYLLCQPNQSNFTRKFTKEEYLSLENSQVQFSSD